MIADNISFRHLLQGGLKFLRMKAGRTLFGLNLEVTLRCNLRCDFCPFWRQKGPEERLSDYSPLVRHLDPLHLTITGGEPLLREDLEEVIRRIRRSTGFVYMNLVTNGSLLTVERARSLKEAGLNQLSVSLDFPDERHDRLRGSPGLQGRIAGLMPRLKRQFDNLCLNTVIMEDNLRDLPRIVEQAHQWGAKVSFSAYNPFKSGNADHFVKAEDLRPLEQTVSDLLELKGRYGNITSSDFYLRRVPLYFSRGGIDGCLAGRKWVQVSPDGTLRRCADMEALGDWRSFRPGRVPLTSCRHCWHACRGEAEAPLGLKRIRELTRKR